MAFRRLGNITFLGALSPRFEQLPGRKRLPIATTTVVDDGTRLDHSLGVATIFLDIAKKMDFSEQIQRYAVAYGLVHDIATWPLSHTGEAAFSHTTGVSGRELRRRMVRSSPDLPEELGLAPALRTMGVDPDRLLSLFSKSQPRDEDNDFIALWTVIRSPITPDSLEGMWRCGVTFRVDVPEPNLVVASMFKGLFEVLITKKHSVHVLRFWRKKAEIYRQYINQKKTVLWESSLSRLLANTFCKLDLVESLLIQENDLVNSLSGLQLPRADGITRYKPPLKYFVRSGLKKNLPQDVPVHCLERYLIKS